MNEPGPSNCNVGVMSALIPCSVQRVVNDCTMWLFWEMFTSEVRFGYNKPLSKKKVSNLCVT